MLRTLRAAACCAVVAVLGATGCSADDQVAAAEEVASDFQALAADGDGAAACRLLAAGARTELEEQAQKPCAEAVLEEQVRVESGPVGADVFGTMAQVRFRGETMFLTGFRDGWRVLAARCRPSDGAFACAIKGA